MHHRPPNHNGAESVYFTVAYILMTIVIVAQVFYYCFVVYSYQSIRKKIIKKGRLLQVLPVISIATVNMPQNQESFRVVTSTPPPVYPGTSRTSESSSERKEVPPPYSP